MTALSWSALELSWVFDVGQMYLDQIVPITSTDAAYRVVVVELEQNYNASMFIVHT